MTLNIVSSFNGVSDPDAAAYIEAVEAADGELLEFAVGKAINNFVLGCKADGIWDAIKTSCILAGARTLEGALVPLAGATAPTKFGTAANWNYDRKLGLKGDGNTNYLNSGRSVNADPTSDVHIASWITEKGNNSATYIGALSSLSPLITTQLNITSASESGAFVNSNLSGAEVAIPNNTFFGATRATSSTFEHRVGSTNYTKSSTALDPGNYNIFVFARNTVGSVVGFSNARLAFYSIGESLDLALLDARVTTLINAFGAAIP